MEVKDKVSISKDHSLEWGDSTWDSGADFSIRNRYDNTVKGGFNVRGSSEIPWEAFNVMINKSIERGHFSRTEIENILVSISKNSLK